MHHEAATTTRSGNGNGGGGGETTASSTSTTSTTTTSSRLARKMMMNGFRRQPSAHTMGTSTNEDYEGEDSTTVQSPEPPNGGGRYGRDGRRDDDDEVDDEVNKLTRKETASVRTWRVIVFLMILAAGALVSGGTFVLLNREQRQDFEASYYSYANTIKDASEFRALNLWTAFRSLSKTITAHAVASNSSFPLVTLPLFEVAGSIAREQSGAEILAFSPLVDNGERKRWEAYCVKNRGWLNESRAVALQQQTKHHNKQTGSSSSSSMTTVSSSSSSNNIEGGGDDREEEEKMYPLIYELGGNPSRPRARPAMSGPYMPLWQVSPPPYRTNSNFDLLTEPELVPLVRAATTARESVLSGVSRLGHGALGSILHGDHEVYHAQFGVPLSDNATSYVEHPHSAMLQPVFGNLDDDPEDSASNIVGIILSIVSWDRYLTDLLPEGVNGIYVVLENTCGQAYTYVVKGNTALYLGPGDKHDPHFSEMEVEFAFADYLYPEVTTSTAGHCVYSFHVYPSARLESAFQTSNPLVFTVAVAAIFFLTGLTFYAYDRTVRQRNNKVKDAALRSSKIVASLFPSTVRDRLFRDTADDAESSGLKLKNFLESDSVGDNKPPGSEIFKSKPIADLFPEVSVLMADICGFTAWSSVREPSQVFILLETVYKAFDDIAKKRRIFKVETVGDCYVAVAGLPDPRKDHFTAICRFARESMHKVTLLTKKLETVLGPDTAELSMRMGIHSGPVTAGVLRGERSRFQLFGDTMNTAARMESTGSPGMIHVSQETAELMVAAGKGHWLTPREGPVVAKGKGELHTYWLEQFEKAGTELMTSTHDVNSSFNQGKSVRNVSGQLSAGKTTRLVSWTVDVLQRLLRQIAARRKALGTVVTAEEEPVQPTGLSSHSTVLDEVVEIITLPKFDAKAAWKQADPESIVLGYNVSVQLEDFVCAVAALYQSNPFHNFEHASHVTMSVVKLLSRIVAPSDIGYEDSGAPRNKKGKKSSMAAHLHDHTYGITSDPLTQFACVFSALIHDVDHSGFPNSQLVKEQTKLAIFYKGKAVAEQNSVDLVWDVLMKEEYKDLRAAIYANESEKRRFRQLVVNSVMATDIMDKDLKNLRNARWEKAFSEDAFLDDSNEESERDAVNRKATIVIEHLIQASDVSHTMQHWHVYRKWNERLFNEMQNAYANGHADKDPAEFWYKGEIGFFDFYIIPLAKKLKDCGVFGVSSDEYLNYALKNRREWEERGQEIVAEMMGRICGREIMHKVASAKKSKQLQRVESVRALRLELSNKI